MPLVTSYTQDDTPSSEDLVYVVGDPAGTPVNRKVEQGNLAVRRAIQVTIAGAQSTGDGKKYFSVPAWAGGYNVESVEAKARVASSSGLPTYMLHNETQAADVLSTALTIDENETYSGTAATPAVVDTANDDLTAGDLMRWDCDVAGTGTTDVFLTVNVVAP